MQASEDWLTSCSSAEEEVARLLSCLGIDQRLEDLGLQLLCRTGPEGVLDVYAATEATLRMVLGLPKGLRTSVTSIGVHIARLRRGRLTPLLGLCSLLARYRLRPRQGYVVVKARGEKLFLYGRDVLPESIATYWPMPRGRCERYPVLVVNEWMEPLGWGRPRRGRDSIYIENILDAGWYLRSGV